MSRLGRFGRFALGVNEQRRLGVNEHQRIDQDSVHDGVNHQEGGSFCAKEFARDGVHLGGGNDEKQESGL